MSEPKIAYVTKYALTQGILNFEVVKDHGRGMLSLRQQGRQYGSSIYTQKDWAPTPKAAAARAEDMRVAKIASLRKQIAKLEALSFDVVDQGGEG